MGYIMIKTNEEMENKIISLKGKLNIKTKSKVFIYCFDKVFGELTQNDINKVS